MLDSVKIKNFQSLRDVSLDLGKFTVVLGASGCGKSAFIRAVLKLVRNDAVSGISFGEEWSHLPPAAANAEVTLSVDGHTVQWVKGKDNRYVIDGEALNKVGKGCPDEVQDVLRMRELTFDGADKYHLNFAQQFDMPFLLDDSGSKVAKILGEITNVNVLYAANRQANGLKATATKTLTVRKQDLEDQKGLLAQFSSLPADKVRLAEILLLQESVAADVELFKELTAYAERLSGLTAQVVESDKKLGLLQHMPKAARLVEAVFEELSTYVELMAVRASVEACKATERKLKVVAKRLDPVRKADIAGLEADLSLYKDMTGSLVRLMYEELHVQDLKESLDEVAVLGSLDVSTLSFNVERYQTLANVLSVLDGQVVNSEISQVALYEAEEILEDAHLLYEEFFEAHPNCPLCDQLVEVHSGM